MSEPGSIRSVKMLVRCQSVGVGVGGTHKFDLQNSGDEGDLSTFCLESCAEFSERAFLLSSTWTVTPTAGGA